MKKIYIPVAVIIVAALSSVIAAEEIVSLPLTSAQARAFYQELKAPSLFISTEVALVVIDDAISARLIAAHIPYTSLLPYDRELEYFLLAPATAEDARRFPSKVRVGVVDADTLLITGPKNALAELNIGQAHLVRVSPSLRPLVEQHRHVSPAAPTHRDYDPLIQTMVDQVQQQDLLDVLTDLVGFVTRNSHTTGCQQATAYVYNAFQDYGLNPSYENHTSGFAPNVIGELPGMVTPDHIYIICGHIDSTAGSPGQPEAAAPGADDNGTGATAVIVAASVLSQYHFASTIRFIVFTGEEQGLYGSEAYAALAAGNNDNILGVINYDMVGYVDQAPEDLEVICDDNSSAFGDSFIEYTGLYTTLLTNKVIDGTMAYSDSWPFWENGYIAFCGIEDYWPVYPYYHTTQDTIDKVNMPFYTLCVKGAAGALATFAEPVPLDIVYQSHTIGDQAGDNDGKLDPGETAQIVVSLHNLRGEISTGVHAQLECFVGAEYLQIQQNSSDYGDMAVDAVVSNQSNPFIVTASLTTPQETLITFMVTVTADGGYQHIVWFDTTVSSATTVCPIYFEPMNANPGWTISAGQWAFGVPTGQGGEHGGPDPTSGHTGFNVYGYNLSGDYTDNMSEYDLTSTPWDCSNYFGVTLKFWRWLGVETSQYDHAKVLVSNNGTQWTSVWENSATLYDGQWVQVSYDISAVADHSSTVYVRWTMGPTDGGWVFCGWNIDDVELCGTTYLALTPTPGPSPSLTPTLLPSPTLTRTPAPTATLTPTISSRTPTATVPPTLTPTATPSQAHSPTVTGTPGPSTPIPSPTPTVGGSSTPTPTAAPNVTLALIMNQAEYVGGNALWLDCNVTNPGTAFQTDLYIALDVFGFYYFYPNWSTDLGHATIQIPGHDVWSSRILALTLPAPIAPQGPYAFWSVMTQPGSFSVIGNIASVWFEFI